MKRNWQAVGPMVHDSYVTITCKNDVQARRLVDVLDSVYTDGQQSVLKAIGDLAGVALPTEQHTDQILVSGSE